jgi:hypothetical protein
MATAMPLTVELLEDRFVPTVFGIPWSNPEHLTLSFVPDGTLIAGQASTLFQTLDAEMPRAVWEGAILRAVQAWVVNANISVGVVADDGEPLGTPGLSQGDPRFGDIRIGARPLSTGSLSFAMPHDPFLSGTWAGDVVLNSGVDFSTPAADLTSVMLHELGHAFGLSDNNDPTSVLYGGSGSLQGQLSTGDVANIEALYGVPAPDATEGSAGNTFTTAARLRSESDDAPIGTQPMVGYGAITTTSDVDMFSWKGITGYTGSMTIRLQTLGLSLLEPILTVFDASGNVLGQTQSTLLGGDDLTLTIQNAVPGNRYFARVQGATSDLFGIGRYGLGVTFDSLNTRTPTQINTMLTGSGMQHSESDLPIHNLATSALPLTTTHGYAANEHYEITDSLGDTSADYYTLQAPAGASAPVLTVTLNALSTNGITAQVTLLDSAGNVVNTDVLVNDGYTITVQTTDLTPGANYMLRVTRTPTHSQGESENESGGNFLLIADFQQPTTLMQTFASGTLATATAQQTFALYVAQDQLFHFALSATGPAGSSVQMTITDANGAVVYTLTAPAGATETIDRFVLAPGAYTVQFSIVTAAGSVSGPVAYQLRGSSLSDPIGPALNDPRLKPGYTVPGDPTTFLYPGDILSFFPFFWLPLVW